MATTSDMNTPEYASKNTDNNQPIPVLFQRIRGRDYGRILREHNKPAPWYQPSPLTRSIYYYDPLYQRYLQQHSRSANNNSYNHLNLSPRIQVSNQSRTRYATTSHYHPPSSTVPSRLRSVPSLPAITAHKKSIGE